MVAGGLAQGGRDALGELAVLAVGQLDLERDEFGHASPLTASQASAWSRWAATWASTTGRSRSSSASVSWARSMRRTNSSRRRRRRRSSRPSESASSRALDRLVHGGPSRGEVVGLPGLLARLRGVVREPAHHWPQLLDAFVQRVAVAVGQLAAPLVDVDRGHRLGAHRGPDRQQR